MRYNWQQPDWPHFRYDLAAVEGALLAFADKASQGAAELMVDVRNTWDEPLTEKSLFAWHRMLFKGEVGKWVGKWRSHVEPMQVVSGAVAKQKVHYEAPPSALVPAEMKAFVR